MTSLTKTRRAWKNRNSASRRMERKKAVEDEDVTKWTVELYIFLPLPVLPFGLKLLPIFPSSQPQSSIHPATSWNIYQDFAFTFTFTRGNWCLFEVSIGVTPFMCATVCVSVTFSAVLLLCVCSCNTLDVPCVLRWLPSFRENPGTRLLFLSPLYCGFWSTFYTYYRNPSWTIHIWLIDWLERRWLPAVKILISWWLGGSNGCRRTKLNGISLNSSYSPLVLQPTISFSLSNQFIPVCSFNPPHLRSFFFSRHSPINIFPRWSPFRRPPLDILFSSVLSECPIHDNLSLFTYLIIFSCWFP